MLQLDSTTQKKFSRHVLVKRLQSADLVFQNNAQAGIIVAEFVSYLREKRAVPASLAGRLFFRPPGGGKEDVTVIDTGVYSRNRSFRLLGQSKCKRNHAVGHV